VPQFTNTPVPPANAANLTIPSGGLALYPINGGGKDQIFQNEDVQVQVRVVNNGTANSRAFVVALEIYYKDNNAPAIATVTASIADLAPGADFLITTGYKHTEGAGRLVYALAKVDPNNAVVESNEADNQTPNIEYVIGAR
jgi:subtilase family serine protease